MKTLATLLERALDATQVTLPYNVEPFGVDISTYRSLLKSSRESYNPSATTYVRALSPVVQDDQIKDQLTDVIRGCLHEYIHNDRIQSAVYAINGGATNGFTIDKLIEHWLDIAIARGPEHAADAFLGGINAPTVQYQTMTLLKGLRVDSELTVCDGIRLVPLPNSRDAFPPYMPALDDPVGPRPEDFTLDTLLVVDTSVSPVFVNPTKTAGDENGIPDVREVFTYEDRSSEEHDFNESQFCEALSLVTDAAVLYAAWWSYIDEDHICKARTSYGHGYNPAALYEHGSGGARVNATNEIVQEALSLYGKRKNLDARVAKWLAVPVVRWIRSHIDQSIVDQFIDLGIALESLYLNDGNNSEAGYRLALRAAWHLGDCSSDRYRLINEFRDIYRLRSRAVHSGSIDYNTNTRNILAGAQEHCRQAIIKLITDGGFPDWDRLVMG